MEASGRGGLREALRRVWRCGGPVGWGKGQWGLLPFDIREGFPKKLCTGALVSSGLPMNQIAI